MTDINTHNHKKYKPGLWPRGRYVRKKKSDPGDCSALNTIGKTFNMFFEFSKSDKYQRWYGILKSANLG